MNSFVVKFFLITSVWATLPTLNAAGPQDTIVYFANETSPEGLEKQNYETLSIWLKEIDTEKAKLVLKNITADQIKFPESIKIEIQNILSVKNASVYIFTNALARKNAFLKKDSFQNPEEKKIPFQRHPQIDPILKSNPLSDLNFMTQILQWLAEDLKTSPKIGIIFKSHGNSEMAITPRVSVWTQSVSKESLKAILNDPSLISYRPGISRMEFTDLISEFQKKLRHSIDIVVLQSCGASPTIQEYKIGSGIQSFFSNSTQSADYDEIDYKQAFSIQPDSSVDSLIKHLRTHPKFREYRALDIRTKFKKTMWYFIPLIIIILWGIVKRRFAR